MIRKTYLFVVIVILLVAAVAVGFFYCKQKLIKPTACSLESKICPDGSAVQRVGSNCEFSKCPDPGSLGTIKGKASVGPNCPVERQNAPCAAKPETYTALEVILYSADKASVVKSMHLTPDGTYQFEVPAGIYIVDVLHSGIGGSKDLPKSLTVKAGETLEADFSFDTGIR